MTATDKEKGISQLRTEMLNVARAPLSDGVVDSVARAPLGDVVVDTVARAPLSDVVVNTVAEPQKRAKSSALQ